MANQANQASQGDQQVSLTISRMLGATPTEVFDAWTDADKLSRWMAPGTLSAQATCEPVEGGRYRIVMHDPDGDDHIIGGVFKELVPSRRVVMTWQWEGSDIETLVTVDLREVEAGHTHMKITHERFRSEDARGQHETGWEGCLAKLSALYPLNRGREAR